MVENMLTPDEVASEVGMNVQTIRKYIRKGIFCAVNWSIGQGHGQRYLVPRAQVDRFKAQGPLFAEERVYTNPQLHAISSGGLSR